MDRLWAQFAKGLADAVTDIREKVVEEPMWGRSLSDHNEPLCWPKAIEGSLGSTERTIERQPDIDFER